MVRDFDVIVVGAGPAGCGAAYDLASAGRKTLLLDKAVFPRIKPCAGALTIKAVRALPFDVSPIVRRSCAAMKLSLGESSRTLGNGESVAVMTVRQEFDEYFVRQCVGRGVTFCCGHRLIALARNDFGWDVQTTAGTFRGKFLIGADGANSQVRKLLSPKNPLRFGVALETCIPTNRAGDYEMEFDFRPIDHGYAWIFPKHDHLNVGLYTLNPTLPQAREKLERFVLQKTGRRITGPIHGHKIPFNGRAFQQRWDDACLVGDAAGMIDPFLGEGIYNALRGGQLAAEAILRAGLAGRADFSAAIGEINRDLASYDSETRRFYSNIQRGYRRLVRWPLGQLLVKGFAAGWPVSRIKRNLLILPLSKKAFLPQMEIR